jgi:hypothetical protein
MNETHLENPDVETSDQAELGRSLAELTVAVGELTAEQELRHTALALAIQVYLKPTWHEYDDIIKVAEDFYQFLSNPGD